MANLIEDVFGGIAHIMEHAKQYGGDPARIGVTGDSAGGHLSAAASLLPNMIGARGFGKTPGVFEFMPSYVPKGKTVDQVRAEMLAAIKAAAPSYGVFRAGRLNLYTDDPAADESWKQAVAPLEHIPSAKERAVPQFQVRGTNDRLVQHADAQEFLDALVQAGQRAEYIQVGGAGHAFFDWKPDENTKATFARYGVYYAAAMKAFFESRSVCGTTRTERTSVSKNVALAVIFLAASSAHAAAQDAATVIASAQKALGDPNSITYSGSAKDVAFQQCGANAADDDLPGHARSDAADHQLRPRHRSRGAGLAPHRRRPTTSGAGGSTTVIPGTFFQQVTPQQADLAQPWAGSLELYITPWGFLKGAAENNATVSRRRVDGRNYTVLTWSPAVKAPSGKSYVDQRLPQRAEPDRAGRDLAGRQHHGRHAHRRHLLGLEGFRRRHGAGEDRPDARRLAVLRS